MSHLMYANATYIHVYYEVYKAMYTEYRHVRQAKMSANVHYVTICQTYYSPNILRIQYVFMNW